MQKEKRKQQSHCRLAERNLFGNSMENRSSSTQSVLDFSTLRTPFVFTDCFCCKALAFVTDLDKSFTSWAVNKFSTLGQQSTDFREDGKWKITHSPTHPPPPDTHKYCAYFVVVNCTAQGILVMGLTIGAVAPLEMEIHGKNSSLCQLGFSVFEILLVLASNLPKRHCQFRVQIRKERNVADRALTHSFLQFMVTHKIPAFVISRKRDAPTSSHPPVCHIDQTKSNIEWSKWRTVLSLRHLNLVFDRERWGKPKKCAWKKNWQKTTDRIIHSCYWEARSRDHIWAFLEWVPQVPCGS